VFVRSQSVCDRLLETACRCGLYCNISFQYTDSRVNTSLCSNTNVGKQRQFPFVFICDLRSLVSEDYRFMLTQSRLAVARNQNRSRVTRSSWSFIEAPMHHTPSASTRSLSPFIKFCPTHRSLYQTSNRSSGFPHLRPKLSGTVCHP